ncbi:YueI family protein [Sediminibacillus terrae]|uniref:YueI family protein n=1 Tax=Sediminibacillus terrae TaxID=1562106 RepID=UPI001387650A|nr:YueI family protein [Sediminibacillus terrae]
MSKENIDNYLEEGMYGAKQTKPAERKRYLGTLRERILLALDKSQVMQQEGFEELAAEMKANPEAKLLLNGKINSRFFKEYKKIARQHNIRYTAVTNKQAETDIGAILTSQSAVDRETIFIEKEEARTSIETDSSQGFKSKIKKWLGLSKR